MGMIRYGLLVWFQAAHGAEGTLIPYNGSHTT